MPTILIVIATKLNQPLFFYVHHVEMLQTLCTLHSFIFLLCSLWTFFFCFSLKKAMIFVGFFCLLLSQSEVIFPHLSHWTICNTIESIANFYITCLNFFLAIRQDNNSKHFVAVVRRHFDEWHNRYRNSLSVDLITARH